MAYKKGLRIVNFYKILVMIMTLTFSNQLLGETSVSKCIKNKFSTELGNEFFVLDIRRKGDNYELKLPLQKSITKITQINWNIDNSFPLAFEGDSYSLASIRTVTDKGFNGALKMLTNLDVFAELFSEKSKISCSSKIKYIYENFQFESFTTSSISIFIYADIVVVINSSTQNIMLILPEDSNYSQIFIRPTNTPSYQRIFDFYTSNN